MAETTNSRLDRIEIKLDQLTEAMVSLARAEEKLVALEQKHSAQYDRMNKFSEKIDILDKKVEDNTRVTQTISKLFWIIAAAAVGIAVKMIMV